MLQLSPLFAALGDATRFAIVERLLREGELSAGELQRGTELSAPSVSRHLKVLGEAGLVSRRVDRQSRIYAVRPEAIEQVCAWTMSHREFWEASLLRLERAMMQEMRRK